MQRETLKLESAIWFSAPSGRYWGSRAGLSPAWRRSRRWAGTWPACWPRRQSRPRQSLVPSHLHQPQTFRAWRLTGKSWRPLTQLCPGRANWVYRD